MSQNLIHPTPIESFRAMASKLPVLDVRAPSEFSQGHLPGAVNVPLFDDEERALVGKTYKQHGREAAVLTGLELVGPKMKAIAEQAQRISRSHSQGEPEIPAAQSTLLVHCWRGGMRSGSVAWLLSQVGFQVHVLIGGYKSYRRWIHASFERAYDLVVISGLTGAGKTDVLLNLQKMGEQIIDLEDLAHHRGSAFGGIGLPAQPSVEQFENNLGETLAALDPHRRIWIEDEGKKIGRIVIPTPFFHQLRNAPAIFLDVPRDVRARLLAHTYGQLDTPEIAEAIENIRKRLGGQNVKLALEQLAQNDLIACTQTLLEYYDNAYMLSKSKMTRVVTVDLKTADPLSSETARQVLELADELPEKLPPPQPNT